MRITQGHLFQRALGDIQRSLTRYAGMQQQVASGKRIEKPSDDPIAALRILPMQGDLKNLGQMSENIALARESLDTGAAALEDASSVMQRVRELTMQASNGTFAQGDRASIGAEITQQHGAIGAREKIREIKNNQPIQRSCHDVFSPSCSAAVATRRRRISEAVMPP